VVGVAQVGEARLLQAGPEASALLPGGLLPVHRQGLAMNCSGSGVAYQVFTVDVRRMNGEVLPVGRRQTGVPDKRPLPQLAPQFVPAAEPQHMLRAPFGASLTWWAENRRETPGYVPKHFSAAAWAAVCAMGWR